MLKLHAIAYLSPLDLGVLLKEGPMKAKRPHPTALITMSSTFTLELTARVEAGMFSALNPHASPFRSIYS